MLNPDQARKMIPKLAKELGRNRYLDTMCAMDWMHRIIQPKGTTNATLILSDYQAVVLAYALELTKEQPKTIKEALGFTEEEEASGWSWPKDIRVDTHTYNRGERRTPPADGSDMMEEVE